MAEAVSWLVDVLSDNGPRICIRIVCPHCLLRSLRSLHSYQLSEALNIFEAFSILREQRVLFMVPGISIVSTSRFKLFNAVFEHLDLAC